jgi:DNA (cytosine-5)-methyltransferase 1
MSLGFEQAGFDVKAAVEIDPIHCAVHKFNFPETAVIPKSVAEVTGRSIRATTGIGRAAVDCVFGGPPCQGFSLIGQRILDDPRNNLVRHFVRLVSELDARTFVFENVKGLTIGRHKAFLAELIQAFDKAGYNVTMPWQVLDAANFGVPQHRERLILFGSKKRLSSIQYPKPFTAAADGKGLRLESTGPTCADALNDLPNADSFSQLSDLDAVETSKFGRPSAYAAELRCLTNDAWHYGYMRKWDPKRLTSSWRTEHTEISRRRFSETEPGTVEPISRFFRLSAAGLSNTLRAGTDSARGAFTSPRPVHYKYARCITVREMARLHGFPDWFRLHATKWHGARQVGNSVPPALARALALEVLKALKISPQKTRRVLVLGEESLLHLDMSAAASHFNVQAPSTRRDRKSGTKKRKQVEIEAARIATLKAMELVL